MNSITRVTESSEGKKGMGATKIEAMRVMELERRGVLCLEKLSKAQVWHLSP